MNRLACSFALLWTLSQPLLAQGIGKPFAVDLSGTETTLTLDFSEHDYELILYSFNAGESLDRTFDFTVSSDFASSAPVVSPHSDAKSAAAANRDRLEFELRRQERVLARRLQQAGGYRPPAPKVVPQEISSIRPFVFPAFGNVTGGTITAALVATSDRAHAYVDVADTSDVMTEQIQAQIDRFSTKTYPLIVSIFGDESDVDNEGKIHVLYTHLVDEVGSGVAGFFDPRSVVPPSQGGNGNLSDLIYVSPTRDEGFYELALAHEFQHLINFNQHVLIRGGAGEEPWLNEGLSHVCEDLIGQHEHNRSYMDIFLLAPHSYSLISSPMSSNGVRGAAYLFIRSLVEEFGSDILSRLVQTDQAGIANVEKAAGQPFADLFDRHVSRIFLSGSGLNNTLNYTTPFLADATTGVRLFPLPQELVVSPQSPSVGEGIKPVSAAYLRLMGNARHTITIQTDAEGDFRAQLIPIPRNYELRIVVPTDYFSGITLDAPLAGPFFTYQPIHFTGTVSDPSVSRIQFLLLHSDGDIEMWLVSPVTNGRVSRTFFFSPEQIGEYQFQVRTGQADEPWSSAGLFSPFTIKEGQGTAPIPVGFFGDIKFSSPLPVEYATGQAIRIAGTVSDPSISDITLEFWHEDNTKTVVFFTPVTDGSFSKTLFFAHKQIGEYRLEVKGLDVKEGIVTATVASHSFSPVIVRKGEGVDQLPVGFFDGITLASPLPVEYVTGQPIRIAGTVSDPSVSQIEFTFSIFSWEGLQGSFEGYLNLFAPVTDGQFNRTLYFSHKEAIGDYTLDIFLWREDDRSWEGRRFKPITVGKGPGVIPIPVDFFDGITFTSPLPVVYTIGQTTRISGTVSDPSVSDINFRFRPIDDIVKSVNLRVPVTNGQFNTTLRLSPEQPVGENYELGIFTRKKGSGQWPWVGSFSPITVKAPPSPDFDGDGTVGFTDFIAFAAAFGKSSGDEDFDARFDLDGDGTVGFTDFIKFAAAFGKPLQN